MRLILFALSFASGMALFAQSGIIKGYVRDASSNSPIDFATVQIMNTTFGANTDENGYFEIKGVKPGTYDIKASILGYEPKVISEILISNVRPSDLDFTLSVTSSNLKEVEIKAASFTRTEESPVSLRTIGATEIQRNPGSNRDISKVLQSLPGVTSTASFRNDLIIRGGAPNENRFYLDDVEVPNINHFATQGSSGGPVGLINVTFIREVDFYSGAFPANRGNSLSSVLNFKQKDGRDDRLGFTFTAGASDAGITAEGPIGKKTTFIASARRSYLQFLFKALELPFLPTYNDFQVKIRTKIDKKNEIYFTGLGAVDQFSLNKEANKTEQQQFILNRLPVSTQWNYTNGLVYKHYDDNGFWTFVLSRNMLNNEAVKYKDNDESNPNNKILDYKSQEIENKFRAERTLRFGDNKLTYGVLYELVKYNTNTFNVIPISGVPTTINYQGDLSFNKYGAFVQYSRKFYSDKLSLSGGLRTDANSYSAQMSNPLEQLSPRASLSYLITPAIAFNANAGSYYQLPAYTLMGYRVNNELVNKANGLKYISNRHFVAGFEYNTQSNSRISIEGFYKFYQNYPMLLRDSLVLANIGGDFGVVGNEPAVPFADGRTYGIELLFQQKLYRGWFGIVAYTLGWSEFQDKNKVYIPSAWDARHIVNLTLGKKFSKNWEVGINWRFQTGLPRTPDAENSSLKQIWDLTGSAIPDYNRLNANRLGAFNQIDLRVDKRWYFKKWNLNAYLDIENLAATAIANQVTILDRPLDENETPVGGPVISNPDAPIEQQRYQTKRISDAIGTRIPSVGLLIEI